MTTTDRSRCTATRSNSPYISLPSTRACRKRSRVLSNRSPGISHPPRTEARGSANAMLYWLTVTAGSAAALQYENMHSTTWHQDPTTAPAGVAIFIQDIAIRWYAEHGDNIMRRSEFERGGHFTGLG